MKKHLSHGSQEPKSITAFFKCPACNSTSVRTTKEAWKCQGCHHTYPLERNIPILVRSWQAHEDELEKARAVKPNWYIEEQSAEDCSPWVHHLRKRREYIETVISQHLQSKEQPRGKILLDLGCGDGNHLQYLQEYAEMTFGSDYNLVRLVRAQALSGSVTLFLADILDYPARDNFFDIIFFNHVIEHIPDDVKALQIVYRILKPGGLLILGTPNEGAWWWQLAYKLQPKMLKITDHVHFYTAESLSTKMTSQGFNLLEVKHMGWGLPHWSLDARTRRYKMLDDLFETLGRRFIPEQASSLYVLATKD